jgi:phosphatidylserine/phosphatidylglycerophosphate/cardiolipin synthase-like enzyme
MRIRISILALLLIVLIDCSAPTPMPSTATPLPPTRAPATATMVPATFVPPTALPPTRVPPTPTALPTLAPLSADQLWQRAQTCNCLVVYTMPEAGSNIILKAIESAKKSIRFKMYLFTRDDIQNALIAAAKRGVDVRVLMELNPFGSGGTNVDIFNAMKGTPIKFRWASYDFRFTHEKSMVIDDQIAFIMTHNITASSFNTNREYGVLTARTDVVSEIVKVYEADWEKIQPDLRDAKLVWSPINARQKWIELIDSAQTSIDLEQNSWSAPAIVERVAAAARRGVRVRAIFSPRDPIDLDGEEPQRDYIRRAGAQVRYINQPYIHAKMFLIDGKRAFIGSENVSDNSLDNNRELGIIFDQADAVAVVQRTFEYDWNALAHVEPFLVSDTAIPASGIVNWKDAARYYNREVTIEGKIVKIYNSGRVMWLQFSEDYQTDMKVVIFPSDWGKFPQRPDLLFMGKTIRVTGKVVEYQGAPEIIVNKPEMIVVVGQ